MRCPSLRWALGLGAALAGPGAQPGAGGAWAQAGVYGGHAGGYTGGYAGGLGGGAAGLGGSYGSAYGDGLASRDFGSLGGAGAARGSDARRDEETLADEVARLRAEVAKLKAPVAGGGGGGRAPSPEAPHGGGGGRSAFYVDSGGAVAGGGAGAGGFAPLGARDAPAVGHSLGGVGGLGAPMGLADASVAPAEDPCLHNPLFATLYSALQKLALLEQDPVEASYQIHIAWERDPTLFDVCPVGLITALVYLSIAQERAWKYKLLHRATYLLYSTPNLASRMAASRWPMTDRLIRTMYHNSEIIGRSKLKFSDNEAQTARAVGQGANDPSIDEAVGFSLQHHDTVKVHFSRVLFYHFYHQENSPCACRTRSWCIPQWTRHFTNHTVDVWLAARDERKTLYRMDRSGCLRSLGIGLASHHFAEAFDLVFVFEINALMHPQCRILPARRILVYPTFDLSEPQMANFEALGVSVLPDDAVLKVPNPGFRALLEETWLQATTSRKARTQRIKDRLVLFAADIRPLKGQTGFLEGLLAQQVAPGGARHANALERLKGLTIVLAGSCDGNQTYCQEVVSLTQQVNTEGRLNIVIADQLKDDELAQLYAASLGVVLHSRIDCNPRAVYEGLVTDTPFFVPETSRLPPLVQHLGHVSYGDDALVAQNLADFVDFCEAGGFTGRPREFARRHLQEAEVYRKLLEWMDARYLDGQVLDPVIRSEDALSGAFGGLGQLLGGGVGAGAAGGGGIDPLRGALMGNTGRPAYQGTAPI